VAVETTDTDPLPVPAPADPVPDDPVIALDDNALDDNALDDNALDDNVVFTTQTWEPSGERARPEGSVPTATVARSWPVPAFRTRRRLSIGSVT
jgi:hypothetical protein